MRAAYLKDHEWAAQRVAPFPATWAGRLLDQWRTGMQAGDTYGANSTLRIRTDQLNTLRIPLDATDSTLCEAAQVLAERCAERATIIHDPEALRGAMARIVRGQGIEPPADKVRTGPALARMCCVMWWRRKLRKHHGRTVEGAAIGLGYVHKGREIYCSDTTLQRRRAQLARNAAALEATTARNELGQEYTLAELAAKGPANKSIRRAELMTRISGFERIARDLGHAGLFLTITCPSRFHKWRTVAGGFKVVENPRHDASENPGTAQRYLAAVWARIRAALHRRGIGVYGFRIAEPQHDGTPHWHFLIFHAEEHGPKIAEIVRDRALADSPDEPGAQAHRTDFKAIDWSRGSAVGYIAKYVSKNIDGYRVDKDLYGNPALESSARVEAWAATWGIRQFQQIGGPPVGVWRELRRIPDGAIPAGAPECLRTAHRASGVVAALEGGPEKSVSWQRYVMAQGGAFCGRAYRVRLTMVQPDKPGRYGDEAAPRPIGVECIERRTVPVEWNPGTVADRVILWAVESVRHTWEILRGSSYAAAKPAPWTRVNNCTEGVPNGNQDIESGAGAGAASGTQRGAGEHEHPDSCPGGAGGEANAGNHRQHPPAAGNSGGGADGCHGGIIG